MAHKKGASRTEILDTIAVAIQMGGGPATPSNPAYMSLAKACPSGPSVRQGWVSDLNETVLKFCLNK